MRHGFDRGVSGRGYDAVVAARQARVRVRSVIEGHTCPVAAVRDRAVMRSPGRAAEKKQRASRAYRPDC
jgi:hypothetical protein